MKKKCENCTEIFVGRSDKRFCSIKCKNDYNNKIRKETKAVTTEIDCFLHRNREILALIMGSSKKETFDKLILIRAGFRFDFFTGIYLNKESKTYHLVYDYAWMSFSDQSILVVRKTK